MIIKKITILILMLISIISCQEIEKNTYSNKKIGWSIDIPENWIITSKKQSEETEKKAIDNMEKELNLEIDASGLIRLLNFHKNQINSFQSGLKSFDPAYAKIWKEYNLGLKKQVLTLYKNQGLKVHSTEMTTIKIDSLDFYTYEFTIENGNTTFKQLMYNRLINGLAFAVNINYDNEADKKIMLDSWLNSKFKK